MKISIRERFKGGYDGAYDAALSSFTIAACVFLAIGVLDSDASTIKPHFTVDEAAEAFSPYGAIATVSGALVGAIRGKSWTA